MSKKIALLFSGQPRTIKYSRNSKSYQSIKYCLLDKYDCDVFCHTWIAPSEIKMNVGPWSDLNSFSCEGNELEIIKDLYNPKIFEYDEPLDETKIKIFKNVANEKAPYNYNSLYYSMKRCFELFETYCNKNNMKYDVIIRIRFDTIVSRLFNLNDIQNNTIYFSNRLNSRPEVLSNQMVISTHYQAISDLMKSYDKFEEYSEDGCMQNDEEICMHVMKKNNHPFILVPLFYFQDLIDRSN
jgi:hypothetical protein